MDIEVPAVPSPHFFEQLYIFIAGLAGVGVVLLHRLAAFLSCLVPLLNLLALVPHHSARHFAVYLIVSTGVPMAISGVCCALMPKILAFRARTQSVLWVEIVSPSVAICMSGFTIFFGLHKWVAFIVSLLLILWGWSLEVALGLTSQLGLTNSTASIAAGYIHVLGAPPLLHFFLMLAPIAILLLLKTVARCYLTQFLPPRHA